MNQRTATKTPPDLAVEDETAVEDLETNKYVCGVKGTYRAGRVVGGEDAVPGEWCWQVCFNICISFSFFDFFSTFCQVALINSLNQYLCGGALIGTQWVLTAAHCVTKYVYIFIWGSHQICSAKNLFSVPRIHFNSM